MTEHAIESIAGAAVIIAFLFFRWLERRHG